MTFIPDCPLDAALTQAAGIDCEVITGQIVGMAFQLRNSSSSFDDLAGIQAETNWNAFASASDATKIVYSPEFGSGLTIPNSERNEAGRDSNESIGGVGILNGGNTVTVTGMFYGLNYATIVALESYTPYSVFSRTRLKAYFILEGKSSTSSRVLAATDGTTYSGIEIYNWRVSTKNLQGFNSKDATMVDFVLKSDWDRNTEIVEDMDFDPKDKLIAGTTASS